MVVVTTGGRYSRVIVRSGLTVLLKKPGVNFAKVLLATFLHKDPKSARRH